jgi:hypothetical protein
MKILAPKGVITVFDDQQEARNIDKGYTPGQTNVYQLNSPKENREPYIEAKRDKEKIEIVADGETKKVYMDDVPDGAVTIGAHLTPEEENELIIFRNKNKDVFVWSAKDLQGVDIDIIEHTLETDEKIPPKKQKHRKMSKEKVKAVEAEVQRLPSRKSYQRSLQSGLASQHCTSEEKERKMENVCRLHKSEQDMQEGRFSIGEGRQNRGTMWPTVKCSHSWTCSQDITK